MVRIGVYNSTCLRVAAARRHMNSEIAQRRDRTVVRAIPYRALRAMGYVQDGPSRVSRRLPTRT